MKEMNDFQLAQEIYEKKHNLLWKEKEEAQKPFGDKIIMIMSIIINFYPNICYGYFKLGKLKELKSRNISLSKEGVYIGWSDYSDYSMFLPIKYITMENEEVLKELEKEDRKVFNFFVDLN